MKLLSFRLKRHKEAAVSCQLTKPFSSMFTVNTEGVNNTTLEWCRINEERVQSFKAQAEMQQVKLILSTGPTGPRQVCLTQAYFFTPN